MRAHVSSRHLSPQSRSCLRSYSCSYHYKDSWSQQSSSFLVCFAWTIPSTLLQAKSRKAFVQRQSMSQCARNPLNEITSPGHASLEPVPLWSVSLALHIPTRYIDLVGYRPGQGQELLLGTLFHVSLHFAMASYQQDALTCHDSNTTTTKPDRQTESLIPFLTVISPHWHSQAILV